MSVATELNNWKVQKKEVELRLADVNNMLNALYELKEALLQRAKKLKSKTSEIAQGLISQNSEAIEEVEKKIQERQKEKRNLNDALKECEQKIYELENDTSFYIQEQVKRMIPELLVYIESHKLEIGYDLERKFSVKGKNKTIEERYGDYTERTGIVGIYDEGNKLWVTSSKDFYFSNKCNKFSVGIYYETISIPTEWYQKFLKDFIAMLLEELKKQYSYEDTFKLTIEDNGFTLELV